jgi:hypothetical protein
MYTVKVTDGDCAPFDLGRQVLIMSEYPHGAKVARLNTGSSLKWRFQSIHSAKICICWPDLISR